jgi:hypothetical protein
MGTVDEKLKLTWAALKGAETQVGGGLTDPNAVPRAAGARTRAPDARSGVAAAPKSFALGRGPRGAPAAGGAAQRGGARARRRAACALLGLAARAAARRRPTPAPATRAQSLYTAVVKATLSDDLVPKEKHVRSESGGGGRGGQGS